MLQRTKAEQVVPVYEDFVSHYSTPRDVSFENPAEIQRLLEPLGLKRRAKRIIALAKELASRGNDVPKVFEKLTELPGVGHYAACAYLSFHLETRTSIVDANAVRLWARVLGLKIEKEMRRNKEFLFLIDKMTPSEEYKTFNYAVLDYTRNVCKQKPLCEICIIGAFCTYYQKNNTSA